MKPIPVKEVTDQLLEDFFRAYWKECGFTEPEFVIKGYVENGLSNFKYNLEQKTHYNDGVRWEIMTDKGAWSNVKVRFKVDDSYGEKPYAEELFHFVIYTNAIATKDWHPHVKKAVKALVEKLEDKFPVVAEL